jgi:hypothetical protein
VRLVSSDSMRTSTYRATSERSAALGLRDCERGSRTGSRFNCTKTGISMSGSTVRAAKPLRSSSAAVNSDLDCFAKKNGGSRKAARN